MATTMHEIKRETTTDGDVVAFGLVRNGKPAGFELHAPVRGEVGIHTFANADTLALAFRVAVTWSAR
jgi:hypothetical protein